MRTMMNSHSVAVRIGIYNNWRNSMIREMGFWLSLFSPIAERVRKNDDKAVPK